MHDHENADHQALLEQQRIRSAPLIVATYVRDETGKMQKEVGPVDFTLYETKLEDCVQELATCEAQLIRLNPTRANQYAEQP